MAAAPNGSQTIAASPILATTTLSPTNGASNPFKRGGGFRSTANARLQNNYTTYALQRQQHLHEGILSANVDTLTFAKWTSAQVCEWLARQGFDAYFPINAEGGQRVHKWIKNGLNLLQATLYDYERV